jgi:hypothetical protein
MPEPTLLPTGYYVENLEQVLRFVSQQHRDLLHTVERRRIEAFLGLSLSARRLYVRLYTRKGPYFRLSTLSYEEIPLMKAAAHELAAAGFLALITDPAGPEEAALLFDLFSKEELLLVVKRRFFSLANKLKKEQLLTAIVDHPEDWVAFSKERFLLVLDASLFSLCEVLFFGNRHQSLTDFVLVDLAKIKYYAYPQNRQPALFQSREELSNYLLAGQALQSAHELSTKEEALRLLALATRWLHHYQPLAAHQRIVDPGRYWQRLAFLSARECERHDEHTTAKEAYRLISSINADPHLQAEAIDRFGLLCQKHGDQAAFEALYQSVSTSGGLDALALYQIDTRRAKLSLGKDPKHTLQITPNITLSLIPVGHQGAKATYQGKTGAALPIELATLEALGGDGAWLENSLWLTLFGVLFWEVLFAPLPGVFVQPFQSGPLDLWSDTFYQRRVGLFEDHFRRLQEGVLPVLTQNDQKYRGYACSFTLWEACPAALLARVAKALGPRVLPIMKRIAQHPNRHSNGLPDLILFEGDDLTLIEVKGPGDTIRLAQRLWHDHLLRAGVSVKIAKVQRG